jgi:hypothetical protein
MDRRVKPGGDDVRDFAHPPYWLSVPSGDPYRSQL